MKKEKPKNGEKPKKHEENRSTKSEKSGKNNKKNSCSLQCWPGLIVARLQAIPNRNRYEQDIALAIFSHVVRRSKQHGPPTAKKKGIDLEDFNSIVTAQFARDCCLLRHASAVVVVHTTCTPLGVARHVWIENTYDPIYVRVNILLD